MHFIDSENRSEPSFALLLLFFICFELQIFKRISVFRTINLSIVVQHPALFKHQIGMLISEFPHKFGMQKALEPLKF